MNKNYNKEQVFNDEISARLDEVFAIAERADIPIVTIVGLARDGANFTQRSRVSGSFVRMSERMIATAALVSADVSVNLSAVAFNLAALTLRKMAGDNSVDADEANEFLRIVMSLVRMHMLVEAIASMDNAALRRMFGSHDGDGKPFSPDEGEDSDGVEVPKEMRDFLRDLLGRTGDADTGEK